MDPKDIVAADWSVLDAQSHAHAVLVGNGSTATSLSLDGFWIKNGSTFTTLNSSTVPTPVQEGGGILVQANASLQLSHTRFTGNKASYGGAIFNAGQTTVQSSYMGSNLSYYGGGALSNGLTGAVRTSVFMNVLDTLLESNTANQYAGAIENWGSLTINRSTFNNNQAPYAAGIANMSSLNVYNSLFTHQKGTYGGAIANLGLAQVVSCSFMDNVSSNTDGNSVVTSYSSSLSPPSTLIDSSILWNTKTPTHQEIGFANADGSPFPVGSLLVVYSDILQPFTGTGISNMSIDPNWDTNERLNSQSRCIGTGNPFVRSSQIGSTDLAGNPRFNGLLDIGAYESP